ncbi:MAG: glycosyltransferase family 2 protein [Actinobacteria bacterium]|nr:glycosyltransferase family 2 protein [Actinomycetota bacterium]
MSAADKAGRTREIEGRTAVSAPRAAGRPTVWLVIVVYNSYTDTADCLRSLAAATWPALHTVLVDNGSTDGCGELLRREFPDVTHLRSDENLGFAGGCNLGIQEALAADADFICLLNNDTIVEPGFIEPLVERSALEPGAGIIGGRILYDEPGETGDIIWYAGGRIEPHTGYTTHRGQDLPDGPAFSRPGQTDYVTGCLFFVRAGLFRELGPLDERMFMYCEELDFCLRARRAGYGCYYEPESVIRHRVSRSMGGAYRPLYYYYQVRNLMEVYRQHLGVRRLSMATKRLWYHLVFRQSQTMLRAHRAAAGPYIAAIWLGYADFLLGRFGRNHHASLESRDNQQLRTAEPGGA